MKFAPKQARFITEYLIDMNAKAAAERAGYSARTAKQLGHHLLTIPKIKAAVEAGIAARAARVELTQDYVLRNLTDIVERCMRPAMFDPRSATAALQLLGKHLGMFTDHLSVKFTREDLEKLPDEELEALAAGRT